MSDNISTVAPPSVIPEPRVISTRDIPDLLRAGLP